MNPLKANLAGVGYCLIEIETGIISRVERLGPEDPAAPFCSPGFVDVQINGFAGINFSAPDFSVEDIGRILPALWATGCTSFCPTLITNSRAGFERNFALLETARREIPGFAASAPCYHLEGPYLSPGPSHGAHDPALMHAPDWTEFQSLQSAAGGQIGIVTLAPELPGAFEFTRRASQAGVVVAVSHTDGTPEDVHQAVAAGATLSTHLGNGCPQIIHRHRAPFWAQLASDGLYASIICDGFHLPPEHVKIIHRVKGLDRCILVTDAVHVARLTPGRYTLGGGEIDLLPTGQVVTANGNSMAGSTLSMDDAVTNFMRMAGVSLAEALVPATRSPAALLKRKSVCRQVAANEVANLTVFELRSGKVVVQQTILAGKRVHG